MGIVNAQAGTRIDEIADGIYRISTALPNAASGGLTCNQFLIVDEEPLLFHTGHRQLLPLVTEAIATVLPLARLRYLGLSHFEADECGALNELLAAAPASVPLCGRLAAATSISDFALRPPRTLADGEQLSLGTRLVRWFDTPHLPHAWESGLLFESHTGTLLCGDLLAQPGAQVAVLTQGDILGPSEQMRHKLDYFANPKRARPLLERLAATQPSTLACMHGSSWQGEGAALLLALAEALER